MKKIKYISILLLTLLVTIGFRMDVRGEPSETCYYESDTEFTPFLKKVIYGTVMGGQPGRDNLYNKNYRIEELRNPLANFELKVTLNSTNDIVYAYTTAGNTTTYKNVIWVKNVLEAKKLNNQCPDAIIFEPIEIERGFYTMSTIGYDNCFTNGPFPFLYESICQAKFYDLKLINVFYSNAMDENGNRIYGTFDEFNNTLQTATCENCFVMKLIGSNPSDNICFDATEIIDETEIEQINKIKNKFGESYELLNNGDYESIVRRVSTTDLKNMWKNYLDNCEYDDIDKCLKEDKKNLKNFISSSTTSTGLKEKFIESEKCKGTDAENDCGMVEYQNQCNSNFVGAKASIIYDFLVSLEEIKEDFEKEEIISDLQNQIEKDCWNRPEISQIQSTSAQRAFVNVCEAEKMGLEIEKISCDDVASQTNEGIVSQYIYIMANNEEQCNGGINCIKAYCENLKIDSKQFIEDSVTGNTDIQNRVNESLNLAYYDMIDTIGKQLIGDEQDICKKYEEYLGKYIDAAMNLIRIAGPILVIILTIMDGIKMFTSMKDDENKKFFDRLTKRLIAIVILFLVPSLIKWLIRLVVSSTIC